MYKKIKEKRKRDALVVAVNYKNVVQTSIVRAYIVGVKEIYKEVQD
jgi:hypothetical protein